MEGGERMQAIEIRKEVRARAARRADGREKLSLEELEQQRAYSDGEE